MSVIALVATFVIGCILFSQATPLSLLLRRLGVVVWVSAIQRFKRRCLDLDGNTKLKSKAGHYGNDLSIVSNAVHYADRNFQAEKFNERYRLIATTA